MKITYIARWLSPLVLALGLASPIQAQPDAALPRPYVQFPIDPNYKKILDDRLKIEQQLGPFKDLVKQILADPKMLHLDPDKIKDMKLENPAFKKALADWVRSDPKLQDSLRDWLKQNQLDQQSPDAKKLHEDLKKLLDRSALKGFEPPRVQDPPDWKNPGKPIRPKDDPITQLTERAMKQTERTPLGERLKKSAAWKQAFEDLRASLDQPDAARGMLGDWPGKLLTADGKTWKLAEDALERLRDLPPPQLDRFTWNLQVPGIGKIPLPDLGPPGMADLSGPALPSSGTAASWLLLLLIGLLVGWRLLRWRKGAASIVPERPDLGPWPVRPEAIATRADLVRAFDYLALWTLGLGVKSWNHHAVVSRWGKTAPACADVARALAKLYEQARYTAGAEQLPEAERDLARRSLLQLAEAL